MDKPLTIVVSEKEADLIIELRKLKFAQVVIYMENNQPDRIEYKGTKKLGTVSRTGLTG